MLTDVVSYNSVNSLVPRLREPVNRGAQHLGQGAVEKSELWIPTELPVVTAAFDQSAIFQFLFGNYLS